MSGSIRPTTRGMPSRRGITQDIYQQNLKGRLSARAYKSGGAWQIERYTYDAEGRLSGKLVVTEGMASHDLWHTYEYDRQGRMTKRGQTAGSYPFAFNLWYDYDVLGRLHRIYAHQNGTKPPTHDVEYTYLATGAGPASLRFRGMTAALPHAYTIRDRLVEIGNVASTQHPFSAEYAYKPAGSVLWSRFHTPASPLPVKRGCTTTPTTTSIESRMRPTLNDGFRYWAGDTYRVHDITYDANTPFLGEDRDARACVRTVEHDVIALQECHAP